MNDMLSELEVVRMVRPILEYGNQILSASLEFVTMGVFLHASQRLIMRLLEGIWVQGCRDKAKLKLRYILASLSDNKYPPQLFDRIGFWSHT